MLSGFEIAGIVSGIAGAGSILTLTYRPKPKPEIEWFTDPELFDLRRQEIEAAREEAIGKCSSATDLQKVKELFDDKIARVKLKRGIG